MKTQRLKEASATHGAEQNSQNRTEPADLEIRLDPTQEKTGLDWTTVDQNR